MISATSSKVTASHLKRNAYLYIRQSTLRQVVDNTESTQRQYALQHRAIALGWPAEQVIVIDTDLGQSGASAADREGFQRLVSEVGLGRAGIVMGLEVSRLARNSTDWHRLLEICALTDTLILDEDGVYDPAHFNDRLLLGLKGTMSEAELHVLRARLRGGVLNKAKRGELRTGLPVGFVYDPEGRVVLDPDRQVQQTLRVFFQLFERTGACLGAVRAFQKKKLLFPRRLRAGANKGSLLWAPLTYSTALHVLHNPRYAGAFVYGQRRWKKRPDGGATVHKLPRDEWFAIHRDAHPGYLSWAQYEANQEQLRRCAMAYGGDRRRSPPREGPALLQGMILCGRCGSRMTVRYRTADRHHVPQYVCQRRKIERAEPICQTIPGQTIDKAIGDLLVETLSPMAVRVALEVQREVQSRIEEADRLRHQEVERCQYEADVARRRFMQVEPENRLVADHLEADWNAKLRALGDAQKRFEEHRQDDRAVIDEAARGEVLAAIQQFPAVWRDPSTADRDRKRLVRLVIEDVTLLAAEQITLHVRFRGGATTTLALPRPLSYFKAIKTRPEVITQIDRLLDTHTDAEVAALLKKRGLHPSLTKDFTVVRIAYLRKAYGIKSLKERLRAGGLLTLREMARKFNVAPEAIKRWRKRGLLKGHAFNDKGEYMYEDPKNDARVRQAVRKAARIRPVAPGSHGYYVRSAV